MSDIANIWSSWPRLIEISVNAVLFYIFIVAMVRLVGKRTTSELNNFDWIINVAVGSLAASGILLKNVSTLDAVAAISVLAVMQYFTTKWVRTTELGSKIVKAQPTLLTHKGEYLRDAMDKARISEEEVRAALRREGVIENAGANWVILETNGQLSVIPHQDGRLDEAEALQDVRVPDEPENGPGHTKEESRDH
ncbi:MAG: YetF domain-containing protein [Pseudomonadota bacterium]